MNGGMSGGLLALFLWYIIRLFDRPRIYPCKYCPDFVKWNGRKWVHRSTGLVEAPDHPPMHWDPLDDESELVAHPAAPLGFAR